MRIKFNLHNFILYVYSLIDPLFLPFGLMYAHLYSPVAFFYVAKWSRSAFLFIITMTTLLLIYTSIILLNGDRIYTADYIINILVLMASIIFAVYLYLYIEHYNNFDILVKNLIKIKFILSGIAFLLLIAGFKKIIWTASAANPGSMRLQMFFYEPSIYALVAAPYVIYILVQFLYEKSKYNFYYLVMALIPLLLAKSAGVLGAIALAALFCNVKAIIRLFSLKYWLIIAVIIAAGLGLASNFLIGRTERILSGSDQSGIVRVVYSFDAATNLIENDGFWLGVGPGQVKYSISGYTSQYKAFGGDRLASSVASTLATVGVLGLTIKLLIMIGLFFYTKGYRNKYSFTLFVFLFIYQFTGGYFNDINEFVALAIALGYARRHNQLRANLDVSEHDGALVAG